MTEVAIVPLTMTAARKLTDDINAGVSKVGDLIHAAREGEAWRALGYENWPSYVDAEFSVSRGQAWRYLNQAAVVRALSTAYGEPIEVSLREAEAITKTAKAKVRQTRPDAPEVTPADLVDASRARDAEPELPAMGRAVDVTGSGPGLRAEPRDPGAFPIWMEPLAEALTVAAGLAEVDVRHFVIAALLAASEQPPVTVTTILERSKVALHNGDPDREIEKETGIPRSTVQRRKREVAESSRWECCGALKGSGAKSTHQNWCDRKG